MHTLWWKALAQSISEKKSYESSDKNDKSNSELTKCMNILIEIIEHKTQYEFWEIQYIGKTCSTFKVESMKPYLINVMNGVAIH